jgi:hypothetical protein
MHSDTTLVARSNGFQKFCAANATDAAFPARIATTTRPTGGGVYDFAASGISPNGLMVPASILVLPFGTGADNATFLMRLYGWRLISDASLTALWVPTILCQFTCTLSTAVGVAGAALIATERLADTLTANAMNNLSTVLVSNALDTPAYFQADIKGFPIIEATFNMNSSATAANALWCAL